jgi:hypothetical protein
MFEQIKSVVKEEASHTPRATMLTITLVVNKTFRSKHLLNKYEQRPMEVLKGDKLFQVMDKFLAMSFPTV